MIGRLKELVEQVERELEGEFEPSERLRRERPELAWQLYDELVKTPFDLPERLWKRPTYEAPPAATVPLFDLPDYVWVSERAKSRAWELAELVKVDVRRVAADYAYHVCAPYGDEKPQVAIFFSSRRGDHPRFKELVDEWRSFAERLRDVMWDSLQYVVYLAEEELYESKVREVLEFYPERWRKYLDVVAYDDIIYIYCPAQLKGRLIGRGGTRVRELGERVGKRVKVVDADALTERWRRDHPSLDLPPEAQRLVAQALNLLKELRKHGVTAEQLDSLLDHVESEEAEELSEEDYQPGW